jgi:hypothetical protein
MSLDRSEQNWPEQITEDLDGVCACGAPMKDGVCSVAECVCNVFGQPVSVYTRAQAIADGLLVDMEDEAFSRARSGLGLLWPVAMTATAFAKCVEVDAAGEALGFDAFSRYWDVCFSLGFAIRRAKAAGISGTELEFSVCCPEDVQLKAVFGPADDASPCITIMLPNED